MSGYNADVSQPAERDDEGRAMERDETIPVTWTDEQYRQLEREKGYEADRAKRYRDLLIHLAEETLSLAETLDYEIGEKLKYALSDLADRGIVDLPTKTVMLTGTFIASFGYGVNVEVPIFTDVEDISHDDYADEIGYSVESDAPIDWQIEPGNTYED